VYFFFSCVKGKGQQLSIYMSEPQPCEYTIGVSIMHYHSIFFAFMVISVIHVTCNKITYWWWL